VIGIPAAVMAAARIDPSEPVYLTLGSFFPYLDQDIDCSVNFHGDIASAIANQQPKLARSLMFAHLEIAHDVFNRRRHGELPDLGA
jgi:hypothetical protein